MSEKITTSVDDPRLAPVSPELALSMLRRHHVVVGDPILPEEFGRRVDDVLNGKIEMLRGILATDGGEIRFEEFAMVVPTDENGVEGEPELGCVFLAEEDGEQHLRYTTKVRGADQRFEFEPTPESIEAGEWDDRWDAKRGVWKTD